jgi:hypothetical protein
MYADEFPIPDDPSKYKEVLRRTASVAEERIRSSIGFGDKRISVYTLTNLSETKDIEKKVNSPGEHAQRLAKILQKLILNEEVYNVRQYLIFLY